MTTNVETPKTRNVLGLISIILAIVGFALAIIPLLGVVGWPLLVAALVLGIIGVTRKGQSKGTSIAGMAVTVVAMISAPIIALGILAASVGEPDATVAPPVSETTESEAEEAEPEEAGVPVEDGTRENPAPLGSEIIGDDWTVVINSVTPGGAVRAGEPEDGHEFVLVDLSATYTGTNPEGEAPFLEVRLSLVTAEGVTSPSAVASVDGSFPWLADLYEGGTASGIEVLQVPAGQLDGSTIAVTTGMMGNKTFIKTQ